ncbi:uncharacterized protein PHACADRAFT_250650 [Phanerochaete carnosa HHB-10118-sp]|uniref:RTA1 like protein n=1 Tax=Phanerochaete carnosa (strain HHB-10118-sp) TaxID=650164 RepID=K5XAD6_PHACS|nr:uncharacterized protein PHACADRAFT_250650 [Phanerochaete carnosa HHB-10118-sp]EKM59872.1 hypothetical protein PHACADRAFT_250650 [Phanerochaete carnosa HHB-10118-sp]
MASRTTSSLLSQALLLLFAFSSLAVARQIPANASDINPFTDPKDDPFNPLGYITSNGLTAMAVAITLAIALPQTWFTWRIGGRFMLAMVIAEYTYTLGIAFRFGLHTNPDSNAFYILYYLFVTLSPCGFIAAEYVLLGRMARWLGANNHVLIPPRRITLVFVCSDVATFLTQAAGGSISASAHTNPSKAQAGSRVFLVGLVLQLVSFAIFMCVYTRFIYRVRKYQPEVWTRDRGMKWYKDWRALASAMWLSCVGILIRSVYRTIELSEGFDGFLTRTEVYFFALDFVPLVLALVCYIPFWPGRFIPANAALPEASPRQPSTDGTLPDKTPDLREKEDEKV